MVWNSSGKLIQQLKTLSAIHSLAYNSRRQQFLFGYNSKVKLYQISNLDEVFTGDLFQPHPSAICTDHQDIVSNIVSTEGRFYSSG